MAVERKGDEMSKPVKALFLLFPAVLIGLLGGFTASSSGNHSFITGFLWGFGIALVGFAVIALGMFAWEWIKEEAEKGKLLPFILVGIAVAIAVSGYLAISLGDPTCVESETDNRGSTCLEYANDGYEATSDQKWNKFWSTLPVTVIIASLIAIIVRNHMEKEKKH
jgi:MFS family permease